MIAITYAYEPEIKALKRLVDNSDFTSMVIWHRWDGRNGFDDNVKLIVNVGFAGALGNKLALGEVVFVDSVVGSDNKPVALKTNSAGEKFVCENVIKKVRLFTSKEPIQSAELRDKLFEQTRAEVVDMEGRFILRAAKEKNVPFVSFKVVSDMADSDTWLMVKQYNEQWSTALANTVVNFLNANK